MENLPAYRFRGLKMYINSKRTVYSLIEYGPNQLRKANSSSRSLEVSNIEIQKMRMRVILPF